MMVQETTLHLMFPSLPPVREEKGRTAEDGRGLLRSSDPTILLKQDHLGQVTQDCVQLGFKWLHRCRV